jgi:hypothetical protein
MIPDPSPQLPQRTSAATDRIAGAQTCLVRTTANVIGEVIEPVTRRRGTPGGAMFDYLSVEPNWCIILPVVSCEAKLGLSTENKNTN